MTDKIVAGCAVFGIQVHDHIVVGRGRRFSFHAHGLLARGETVFEYSEWLAKRRRPRASAAQKARAVRAAAGSIDASGLHQGGAAGTA